MSKDEIVSRLRALEDEGDTARVAGSWSRLNASASGPVVRSFGRSLDVLVRCDASRRRLKERRAEREPSIPGAPTT
jgi:hypothetical protein